MLFLTIWKQGLPFQTNKNFKNLHLVLNMNKREISAANSLENEKEKWTRTGFRDSNVQVLKENASELERFDKFFNRAAAKRGYSLYGKTLFDILLDESLDEMKEVDAPTNDVLKNFKNLSLEDKAEGMCNITQPYKKSQDDVNNKVQFASQIHKMVHKHAAGNPNSECRKPQVQRDLRAKALNLCSGDESSVAHPAETQNKWRPTIIKLRPFVKNPEKPSLNCEIITEKRESTVPLRDTVLD